MPVDLQPNVLARRTEVVEEDGVLLRGEHVGGDLIGGWRPAHRRPERLAGRHLRGDPVRRVVGVGRDLHRELATGPQRRPPPRDHTDVVGHPLQRGVADDQVVVAAPGPRRDVAALEPDMRPGVGRGLLEHVRRRVDAGHRADLPSRHELGGQRPRAAAEVDGSGDRTVLDETGEVPERLRPLGGELVVLAGIPRVRHTSTIQVCARCWRRGPPSPARRLSKSS